MTVDLSPTQTTTTRRTPLADLAPQEAVLAERIGLRELAFVPQLSVRVREKRIAGSILDGLLPTEPTTWIERDGVTALWFGPDEWLLLGEPLAEQGYADSVRDAVAGHGTVVEVSAQRVVLEVSGPHVRNVLAHGCSLDLHRRAWRPGAVAQTLLARAPIALVMRATDPDTAWLLVRASLTSYVISWLVDASLDVDPGRGSG